MLYITSYAHHHQPHALMIFISYSMVVIRVAVSIIKTSIASSPSPLIRIAIIIRQSSLRHVVGMLPHVGVSDILVMFLVLVSTSMLIIMILRLLHLHCLVKSSSFVFIHPEYLTQFLPLFVGGCSWLLFLLASSVLSADSACVHVCRCIFELASFDCLFISLFSFVYLFCLCGCLFVFFVCSFVCLRVCA